MQDNVICKGNGHCLAAAMSKKRLQFLNITSIMCRFSFSKHQTLETCTSYLQADTSGLNISHKYYSLFRMISYCLWWLMIHRSLCGWKCKMSTQQHYSRRQRGSFWSWGMTSDKIWSHLECSPCLKRWVQTLYPWELGVHAKRRDLGSRMNIICDMYNG